MAPARGRREGWADDDIGDPAGQPLEVHHGEAIADALLPVVRRIAGVMTVGREGSVGRAGTGETSSHQ
jgi:hypothetical protein